MTERYILAIDQGTTSSQACRIVSIEDGSID